MLTTRFIAPSTRRYGELSAKPAAELAWELGCIVGEGWWEMVGGLVPHLFVDFLLLSRPDGRPSFLAFLLGSLWIATRTSCFRIANAWTFAEVDVDLSFSSLAGACSKERSHLTAD